MTVRQLRKAIEHLHDDCEIILWIRSDEGELQASAIMPDAIVIECEHCKGGATLHITEVE
jgi:hypothetical protein